MAERRYSISQAGRLVGVENHVLRYWEDELHLEIPRDRKNQRYYTKLHIEMFQKINELKEKTGTSVMMITHDLGVIAEVADDVMVMYAGKVVEHATCDQIFDKPMHPYTDGLMKCIPKLNDDDTKELSVIKGMVPSFDDMPAGCAFCPRCPEAREICRQKMPELVEAEGRKVRCFKYTKEWGENI